jgi:hypothetical protein
MPAAVGLRPDWDAKRVGAAAREAKDVDQARRLRAIAAAYQGHARARLARRRPGSARWTLRGGASGCAASMRRGRRD